MPCFEVWNGCARFSACTDGELAGRKLLCESLATSERPGKALTETIVINTHPITIGQRNRTEKFPMDANQRLVMRSPGGRGFGLRASDRVWVHGVPSCPG